MAVGCLKDPSFEFRRKSGGARLLTFFDEIKVEGIQDLFYKGKGWWMKDVEIIIIFSIFFILRKKKNLFVYNK